MNELALFAGAGGGSPTQGPGWDQAGTKSGPSMQKHRSCRNFVTVFGKPSPQNFEYLMGWPSGWTDLKPLGMDKFLLWQQSHFVN